jgi:hemolysin III
MAEGYRPSCTSIAPMSAATVPKPKLRGWFHEVGFFVSVPAGVGLVAQARDPVGRLTALVYAVSLTAVFGASAAYHRVRWSPAARRRMKRLDHSMIFVLIAGTYTPVCALALDAPWSVVLLGVVWSGAAVGIVLKVACV